MQRLNDNLFLIGNNCFNKNTLEVFSLDEDHVIVLKSLTANQDIPKKYHEISREIKKSGILNGRQDTKKYKYFSPKFVAFRIVLGKICNLRCRDCFVLESGFKPVKMSKSNLKMILGKTFAYGKNYKIKYHFFGGEPLMMFDLIKKGVAQIEQAYLNRIIEKPIFTVTTNGTLMNKEIAAFFKKHDFKVGISIDGPRKNNDLIRGKGVFDKVEAAFRLLEKYDVERWFLITPYSDIIDIIPSFIKKLKHDFSFRTITLNTPFNGNDLTWAVDGRILADTILECHKLAKKLYFNIESAAAPVLYALSSYVKRNYPCSIAGNEVMGAISPEGRISSCAQYWSDDLFKEKFLDNFSISFKAQELEACQNCIAENICGGVCLVHYAKKKKIDKNKCKFYLRLIEKLISDPMEYLSNDQISKETV